MFLLVSLGLSLPFLAIIAFKPVLRKLALRDAIRRPKEMTLVVLGSMLGTAMLTGSFLVNDTLAATNRQAIPTQLGPVDELVMLPGANRSGEIIETLGPLANDPRIDGLLGAVSAPASATAIDEKIVGADGRRAAVARAQMLEIDLDLAQAFGGDPEVTGVTASTPQPGHVVITTDVARNLQAKAGDTIVTRAYGQALTLKVDKVLEQHGIAGFWRGPERRSYNLFVTPGTIASLVKNIPVKIPLMAMPQSMLLISNKGGVYEGAKFSDALTSEIEKATAPLDARVEPIKANLIANAKEIGGRMGEMFTAAATFGVIAGLLLIVNVMVMLAQERKSELGMLRAIGLRQSGLIAAFSTQGWLIAVASSALGAVTGLGLTKIVTTLSEGLLGGGSNADLKVPVQFVATWASIQRGFTVGFAVTLLTVVITSVKVTRVNIIQAIRELNDAPGKTKGPLPRIAGAVMIIGGGIWSITSLISNEPFGTLFGPMVLISGAVPWLIRVAPPRLVLSVVSALSIAWGIGGMMVALGDGGLGSKAVILGIGEGVALTAAGVTLVSQNQSFGRSLMRATGNKSMALHLGMSYPLAQRFRTAMTLAMFSLVIFTFTFVSLLSHILSSEIDGLTDTVAGNADAIAFYSPAAPLPLDELRARPEVENVVALATLDVRYQTPSMSKPQDWPLAAFDEDYLAMGPPQIVNTGDYPSADAAYQAVLNDPSLIIVDTKFLRVGSGVPKQAAPIGTSITVIDPEGGQRREVTVAAIAAPDTDFHGALYGRAGAATFFGDRIAESRAYVDLVDGADSERFARDISDAYVNRGVQSFAFKTLVASALATQDQFFRLLRGYLALGLMVGIAGLSVITVRAVRERRRQIAILRSLGFPANAVGRSLIYESLIVALQATLLGVSLSMITAFNLVEGSDMFYAIFGSPASFSVPVAPIAVLVVITIVGALLATMGPAWSATRLKPAIGLRVAD